MKVAIMQPYFFPYMGYFNLIAASDIFISLDNVQHITRGFVNRNRILQPNGIYTFTVPLQSAPRAFFINQRTLAPEYEALKKKFMLQLEASYKKAPFFKETLAMIHSVLDSTERNLARICEQTILAVMARIGLQRKFLIASRLGDQVPAGTASGQVRIIDIVKLVNGTHYINPIGGIGLYCKDFFSNQDIRLSFLRPLLPPYKQNREQFIPALSILDVLMFNSPEETLAMTARYEMLD